MSAENKNTMGKTYNCDYDNQLVECEADKKKLGNSTIKESSMINFLGQKKIY